LYGTVFEISRLFFYNLFPTLRQAWFAHNLVTSVAIGIELSALGTYLKILLCSTSSHAGGQEKSAIIILMAYFKTVSKSFKDIDFYLIE